MPRLQVVRFVYKRNVDQPLVNQPTNRPRPDDLINWPAFVNGEGRTEPNWIRSVTNNYFK